MYTYKTQSQSVFVIKVQKEDKLVFKVIGHIFLFNLFLFFLQHYVFLFIK